MSNQLQLDALKEAGCENIFTDYASGAKTGRSELVGALNYLRPGDTRALWKLDCLARSLQHLIQVVGELQEQNVTIQPNR